MKYRVLSRALLVSAGLALMLATILVPLPAPAQQTAAPTVRTTVDEVLLDLIVRDKKGKPLTDLKPEDLTVLDNGAKQTLTSFRLVSGSEAITSSGAKTALDPLRQVRLVTLAFEAMTEADQRKLARTAAIDLIKGDQGTNVYYAVVVINTQLFVLQPFTNDKAALTKAIERATGGLGGPGFASESDAILAELKRNLGGQNGADQPGNLIDAATQTAGQPVNNGSDALQARLASVMLDMLRMDAAVASQGARLTLSALRALVDGQRSIPGRKSVIYFTWGMYLTPELDVPFHSLMSTANRDNVTFYSVDTRGVMTGAQNSGARSQLNGAARASATTMTQVSGPVTKEQVMASDNAEVSARSNVQESIRDLAESTGGFLIGDSNDLRLPLRHVNEEISSYYEVSFNPGIQNYDGGFRKIAVNANRKDLVIHARNGYFALPPEARAAGLQPFELPLLKILSEAKVSEDVKFRVGAILLQPRAEATGVAILVEVPLHELQPKAGPAQGVSARSVSAQSVTAKAALDIHCSLVALVKDSKGEVVQKLTRDRGFQVTPDQLKMGNFLDKMTVALPPGKYSLESAVMDRESGKIGTERSSFTVPPKAAGVAISSLTPMRSYIPNAKGLDPSDPFQFQGGSITPTMDLTVKKAPNAVLRLFFTVYGDASVSAAPAVEIEFLQAGKSLTKVPMQLPAADAQGRIPYLMTIPAESIPSGNYEVRATAKQGSTTASASTMIVIE
ncbi:MAG TPA: VWA domain-containing protein [Candidatus Acidoferrales bacterium]|jgi:VWFA-related protein|nr:VWA domain-containing protein [Candidatus Acidoferrales bacterium]